MIQKLEFISETISGTPCSNCGGDVQEYSIPSDVWNIVVRRRGKEANNEYLCVWCFASAFVCWFHDVLPVPQRDIQKSDIEESLSLLDDIKYFGGGVDTTIEQVVKRARREHFEMVTALVEAERYMKGQRAKSKSPFDPEALKRVRAVLSKLSMPR